MNKINNSIVKTVIFFLTPIILILALYIQFHGDYSPGGGFQSGSIAASILIVYSMVTGYTFPIFHIKFMAMIGVLLYSSVGITTMLKGSEFLHYSVLLLDPVSGQGLGVILVEIGVAITVLSAMLLIYTSLNER